MTHQLELLAPLEDKEALFALVEESLCGQRWAAKSNVVFYWSFVPYRSEWRYGIHAHRMIMRTWATWGRTCTWPAPPWGWAPAASAPMTRSCVTRPSSWTGRRSSPSTPKAWGTVKDEDEGKEKAFYSFVEEQ